MEVSDFPDEYNVRIVSQDGPESGGVSQSGDGIGGDLVDDVEAILDRILEGDDFLIERVDVVEHSTEGGGFAASGGARDKNKS